MEIKKITVATICISLTAVVVALTNMRAACIQEAKLIKRLEKVYARSCKEGDKKCLRKAKRAANKERSWICTII